LVFFTQLLLTPGRNGRFAFDVAVRRRSQRILVREQHDARMQEAEGGDHMNLSDKVKSILSEQLNVEPADLMDSTSFEDLNADSLTVVEVIMALEEEFDIEIPDEDAENMRTVGDVIEYIHSRVSQ